MCGKRELILGRLGFQCLRIGHGQRLDRILALVKIKALGHLLRLVDFPDVEPFRHQLCQDCLHRFAIEPGKTIRRLDGILRGVGLHRPGQLMGVAEVIHFLEKPKTIRKRRAELLGVAVIDTLLSQHVEIPQQHGGNVVPVRQALGRQLHREGK